MKQNYALLCAFAILLSLAIRLEAKPLPDDPYEIMSVAFVGNPRQEDIKPLVELVLRRHKTPLTRDNILGLANGLVVMRKESKSGVTEMAILRHMAKTGSSRLSLGQQLGLSATLLE